MVNINMGQYYAWSNFTKLIKSLHRKYFYTPKYTFKYIQPKVHTQFKFIPYQEWKANRVRDESQYKYVVLSLAFIGYFIGKYIYQVREDEDEGYYYHLNYPIPSQSMVWITNDIAQFVRPFFDIMPKDVYEITQVYPRLYELIFDSKTKIIQQDRKVQQLKKEMKQYDKKNM